MAATKLTLYAFNVTLAGLKGFQRLYHVGAGVSLYTFHKQMRADMEFPQDQMILFKAFDEVGDVIGRFSLIDLGQGKVDEVSLKTLVEGGVVRMTYFYDVQNKKSVEIAYEGIVEKPTLDDTGAPLVVFSKGPNPIDFENGYVAYEDLPDDQKHIHRSASPLDALLGGLDDEADEDFDDEDEDEADDDEDGKEIYDGSDPV